MQSRESTHDKFQSRWSTEDFILIGVCVLTANLFALFFVGQEKFLYFWDYANYWSKVELMRNVISSSLYKGIYSVYWSMRHNDYNLVAAFILWPFIKLFGNNRLMYILAIVNMFALPGVLFFVALNKVVMRKLFAYDSAIVTVLALTTIMLSPQFWTPILMGYVGVGGIVVIIFIFILYCHEPLCRQSWYYLLLIAILIPSLVLFRRWYAFWGVAFYLTAFFDALLQALFPARSNIKDRLIPLAKVSAAVVISAIFFFAIAGPYAVKIAHGSRGAFSAYKSGKNFIWLLYYNWGALFLMLLVISSAIGLSHSRTRRLTFLLLLQIMIIFTLFVNTQDFGHHHYYLLLPSFLLLISILAIQAYRFCDAASFKFLCIGGYSMFLALNFISVFDFRAQDKSFVEFLKPAFCSESYSPLKRKDMPEMERLMGTLNDYLKRDSDRVYVLASSKILNCSIFQNAWLSLGRYKKLSKQTLYTPDVDKRDGFPSSILSARYVVVASPPQYHLRAEDQRIVEVIAELFLNQENIGKAYRRLPNEFHIGSDILAYIYERDKPISEEDIRELSETFKKYYPDRDYLYRINKSQDIFK